MTDGLPYITINSYIEDNLKKLFRESNTYDEFGKKYIILDDGDKKNGFVENNIPIRKNLGEN
jgi:hypothetical protein